MARAGAWMRDNLTTQGYCLSDAERRELAIGLRFSTGLCLTLVVVALVLESAAIVFALSAIGVVAGSAHVTWWARRTQRKQSVTT